MIKNYFKIAWRNIIRHKSYSAINVAGLSVGIASCLLIFIVIQYELSFDTSQPNYKNIYRIITQEVHKDGINNNPGIAAPAVDAFRLSFPQAKVAGLQSSYGSQVTVPGSSGNPATDKKFIENMGVMFIEPQYFDIFKSSWLAGQPSALKAPNMVVIDKSSAVKYFGDWKNAMGKTLKMDNVLTLKVAGIIEDAPSNSDFPLKVLISYLTWKQHPKDYGYQNTWNSVSSNHQVFMLFPSNVTLSTINRQFRTFSDKQFDNNKNAGKKYQVAQPLSTLHFDTQLGGSTLGDHVTSMSTLRTLSFIAVLIIIMASINFINLSTAQSVGRSKEVGIRKVLGSSRPQLIIQVISETAIIVLVAVVLALIIAKVSLPFLKNIASVPDDMGLINTGTLLFLVGITLVVVLLSGLYPALIVSGFKPVLALKNKITAASVGGVPLRRALVVLQFGISQLLIIGTVVAINQMDFVNKADLGFDKSAVLIIPGYTDSVSQRKIDGFKQQLLQNPAVLSASFTSDAPSSDNNSSTNFYFNHSKKDPGFHLYLKIGDADYFKTFGLHFIAGKGFEAADTMRQVVINETLMAKLGIRHPEDALGKTISLGNATWASITGVVKDFKTNSLREVVKPTIIYPQKIYESEVAVKIQTKDLAKTVASVQKLWEDTYPEYAYNGFFLDDNIAKFYKQENQLALVYKIFACIAIFISCLGLYGLVSFMAVQRTKEVGIRKVLGASVSSIVFLFSKEFMVLITISFVIAVPAAWYIMTGWLQNFAYRITMNAWIFIAAIAVSAVIAWVTVGYKAVKAALVNPVRSLKSE
ncbi:ABC transporter permease [Mucilaginibacter gotjawali]|uniref:Permease n=2 Tax=Mucilaginibacter gotjawali TaxID=1550579 RepID=A0A839S867_9SPHI|nr:ABC transporter permease [Mucilaginibacter gotjawali]MBB3054125.1 putative permease [Mucilaginibacter gotjawali]BAU54394.1 Macrolide export ATP-binding/permease protein MacB [Mucilaginibacter gotjawali]